MIVHVPASEFEQYEKYSPPVCRFTSNTTDECNLMFKGISVVPRVNLDVPTWPEPDIYSKVWTWFKGICVDCPADEKQMDYARIYFTQSGHYQHWTYNAKETYEQMVGDECYDGINV